VEILKDLQTLIDNRDARERIDGGAIGELKGRNHWVFHLLLRALESNQAHTDRLIGSAYANILARIQAIEDRLTSAHEAEAADRGELGGKLDGLSTSVSEKLDRGMADAATRIADTVAARFTRELDERWKPVGESLDSFALGSRQMLKDVADTYKVATQTRLLLNENARRMADLGKDILALEDSVKLVVQKQIEESLKPLQERIAQLEAHLAAAVAASEAAAAALSAAVPMEAAPAEGSAPVENPAPAEAPTPAAPNGAGPGRAASGP
jgi:BMFP domain-containing protein YqiC